MAISIPSDLVLDVVKAADPVAQQHATIALGSSNGVRAQPSESALQNASLDDESFQQTFSSVAQPAVLSDARGSLSRYQMAPVSTPVGEKFEAMLLHQFLETMLPRESEAVFGKGTAGEIWRSMLAEQVGAQMAKTKAIGLASYLKIPEQSNPAT
ncbi:rod-binding protein [Cohaesibacter celericrescens]|uniref:rod-binding protein n=1 Tax=Cohaesibacter celericrescens TaxID=2067669 RepID=UPI0035617908